MKKILGISLGSSKRDFSIKTNLGDHTFEVRRIGTDGDMKKMRSLFQKYDGKVDAFGIGGFDLWVYAGRNKKIPFREPQKIIKGISTPILDGASLKLTLEYDVIKFLHVDKKINLSDKKAFCIVGVDRFGMAEALEEFCKCVIFGDLMVSVGIPLAISKLHTLVNIAKFLAPVILKLPYSFLYPTGSHQEKRDTSLIKYFNDADIIAGDFHYINKYRPDRLDNKTIITNTTTMENIHMLKDSGCEDVITTTPLIDGRTFGTNILEAMLFVCIDKKMPALEDYSGVIEKYKLQYGHRNFWGRS